MFELSKIAEKIQMDTVQRMVPLDAGKRAGVRLDQATWQAIDWLADQSGKTWQQWCAKVIAATPDSKNATASVRVAAMDGLLCSTVFAGRGESLDAMEANLLTRRSSMLNDEQLSAFLETATVHGQSDFVAFTTMFGQDENGEDFLIVRNSMRDGLHFATLAPEGGS
jgi:predicted DNA-binding ribbon-helix-helix protein